MAMHGFGTTGSKPGRSQLVTYSPGLDGCPVKASRTRRSWRSWVGPMGDMPRFQAAIVDPTVFKAVVAVAPVTDLEVFKEERRRWSDFELVSEFVGNGRHMHEGSPAEHADRIKAPVLLFHGSSDRNVSIDQSKRMAERLAAAGGKCELITWEDLDHYLEDSKAREQMLRKSDEFIRRAFWNVARFGLCGTRLPSNCSFGLTLPQPPSPKSRLLGRMLHSEAGSSVLLLAATIAALLWANSSWEPVYRHLLEVPLTLGAGELSISQSLQFWVNEGLMAVFFPGRGARDPPRVH